MPHREVTPGMRRPGTHDQWRAAVIWLGQALDFLEGEVSSVDIERPALGPEAFCDGDPLLSEDVALVMRQQLGAEHLEFGGIPAGNEIEAEAAFADMVGRGDL